MLRWAFMIVTMAPLLGGFALLLGLAPQLIDDTFEPWMTAIVIGYAVAFMVGYYLFLDRIRPPSDIPHLKVPLEANGDRVQTVIPAGVRLGGRSGPDFRIYRARVRKPDGSEEVHTIEVEATLLGGGLVRDKTHPKRSAFDFSG